MKTIRILVAALLVTSLAQCNGGAATFSGKKIANPDGVDSCLSTSGPAASCALPLLEFTDFESGFSNGPSEDVLRIITSQDDLNDLRDELDLEADAPIGTTDFTKNVLLFVAKSTVFSGTVDVYSIYLNTDYLVVALDEERVTCKPDDGTSLEAPYALYEIARSEFTLFNITTDIFLSAQENEIEVDLCD
jgi:hypothetical protein